MSGGSRGDDQVSSSRRMRRFRTPSGRLFGVVAVFAQSLTVDLGGRATVCMRDDVVDMPNRGIAIRGPVRLIAESDQGGQCFREDS